jgi:hypothetical protein
LCHSLAIVKGFKTIWLIENGPREAKLAVSFNSGINFRFDAYKGYIFCVSNYDNSQRFINLNGNLIASSLYLKNGKHMMDLVINK